MLFFCEKVVVDVMIEEKIIYVKYKIEGCYKINLDIFYFIIFFICVLFIFCMSNYNMLNLI